MVALSETIHFQGDTYVLYKFSMLVLATAEASGYITKKLKFNTSGVSIDSKCEFSVGRTV